MQSLNILIEELRGKVITGQTRPESWRRLQLKRVKELINENESEIINALKEDLEKPPTEAFFEILSLKQELSLIQRELSQWVKPRREKVPIWLQPGEAKVIAEPLGCVLIIGAWNYPFMLTMQPLISALAAGNTAIIKPSEFSPSTSQVIEKLISKYFPDDEVKVLQGDGSFAKDLLKERFDYIFFTGGGKIGSLVMSAAAKHLTPVTLELGGKNPALVIKEADIDVTAKRLIWGKGLNSGQTCLAPNHLLVHEDIRDKLINKMKGYIINFYGEKPEESNDIANLNKRQFDSIVKLIETARKDKNIIFGGNINSYQKKVSPTLVDLESIESSILSEEIFGPILPILTISSFEEGLQLIREHEKPLAIYMFGGDKHDQERLINTTSSGSICINDVIIQAGIPSLPFGGVGSSGTGKYHGKAGFDTFSHQKSILQRPFWLDLNFRYPPYKFDVSFMNKLIK